MAFFLRADGGVSRASPPLRRAQSLANISGVKVVGRWIGCRQATARACPYSFCSMRKRREKGRDRLAPYPLGQNNARSCPQSTSLPGPHPALSLIKHTQGGKITVEYVWIGGTGSVRPGWRVEKKIKQASSLCALKQAPRATALKTSSPLSTPRTSAPRPVPYPPSPNRRPTCPSGTMMGRLRGRSVDWRRSEAEGVESHARPVAPSQPTSHPIPILPSHIILRLLFPFLSRLPATIRRSTSSRKPSTRTPSGAATTSWSCATRTTRPPRTGAPRS